MYPSFDDQHLWSYLQQQCKVHPEHCSICGKGIFLLSGYQDAEDGIPIFSHPLGILQLSHQRCQECFNARIMLSLEYDGIRETVPDEIVNKIHCIRHVTLPTLQRDCVPYITTVANVLQGSNQGP